MNTTPTSDPGSVAIRIARANKRECTLRNTCPDAKLPALKPIAHIRKDGHTWLEDSMEVTFLNMIYPG